MAKSRPPSGKASANRSKKVEAAAVPPEHKDIALERLHFDPDNPRFAGEGNASGDQDLLDQIVDKFGVEDVLSSIAVNGYMNTEPLVGVELPNDRGVCIKEGNRRLAALLILADDPRAKNHANLRA